MYRLACGRVASMRKTLRRVCADLRHFHLIGELNELSLANEGIGLRR
jgi:hypothetical protein